MVTPIKGNKKDNSRRRYTGGGPRPDYSEIKKNEAKQRQAAWSALTPEQQLAALDTRLGKGTGAAKQRARIEAEVARRSKNVHAQTKDVKEGSIAGNQKLKAKDRRARERKNVTR